MQSLNFSDMQSSSLIQTILSECKMLSTSHKQESNLKNFVCITIIES